MYKLYFYIYIYNISPIFIFPKSQDLYIMMTLPAVVFRFVIFTIAIVTGGGGGADKEWAIRGTGIRDSIL